MRYAIDFNISAGQLLPFYLRGVRLLKFLNSTLKPLQSLNMDFREYAKEERIKAAMNSQVIKLEWFLTRMFKKHFANEAENICIVNRQMLGTAVFNQAYENININVEHLSLFNNNETPAADNQHAVFYQDGEMTEMCPCSFVVEVPKLKTKLPGGIKEKELINQLRHQIETYRLAGRTYKIRINNQLI